MAQVLVHILDSASERPTPILDKRFSRSIAEVGKPSLRKIGRFGSLFVRTLRFAQKNRGSVCIYFTTNRRPSLIVDLTIMTILRLFGMRIIGYVHTSGYARLAASNPAWGFFVRRLFARCCDVVALGESLAEDVKQATGRDRIEVVPNTPAAALVPCRSVEKNTILFMSNLIPEKGIMDFIDVAQALSELYPSLSFSVAGAPGPDPSNEKAARAKAQGLVDAGRFVWRGMLLGEEKWAAIAEAKLLLFPSRYRFEAQPLTIIESFSQATPVLAYPTGGIPDMINKDNGQIVENASQMAEVAGQLLGDPKSLARLQSSTRRQYEDRFGPDSFTNSWTEIINSHARQ